jgi:AAA15 family ATPase/GTPase
VDTIRVKNLKSITDSGEIEIKPITVFVGQNSSGKSSLIRCFPLFKQSAESKILGTVLWSGKYVDYGSFDESVKHGLDVKDSREISFSFSFKISSGHVRSSLAAESLVKLTIKVYGDEYGKSSYTDISYEMYGNKFSIRTNPEFKIISLHINEVDFTKQALESFQIYKIYTIIPVLFRNARTAVQYGSHYVTLIREITNHVHHRTSEFKIQQIARNLKFSDDETIKKSLSNKALVGDYAAAKISQWKITDKKFKSIKDQIIFVNLERITDEIADNFRAHFLASRYITPLRAAADRYYRIQNTSIEELDPNGSNLAMFLYAKKESEIDEINLWLKSEIGFSIEIVGSHGHASIFIIDGEEGSKTNIADTGFGISQILPVLIQVWQQSKRSNLGIGIKNTPTMIVIEQPELHLHPRMQSRVGEAFCRAIKLAKSKNIDLRIIIETHSREIIDAIGRSIERETIGKDDAGIYILSKGRDINVRRSHFDAGGFLEQWPYGFFDGQ